MAWRDAEVIAHTEAARYIVVQDASEPHRMPERTFTAEAAAELSALREAAQSAQDAYVQAIATA